MLDVFITMVIFLIIALLALASYTVLVVAGWFYLKIFAKNDESLFGYLKRVFK